MNDNASAHSDLLRRAALLVALCLCIAIVAASSTLHEELLKVLNESRDIIQSYPTVGIFLFVVCAALSAMLAFVSSAVLVPVAVYTWGAPLSLLLLWLGWILGGCVSYSIGRMFGRAMLRWLTSDDTVRKLDGRVGTDAPFALVLLLQFALPSEIPGYLLGVVRYRFHRYLLALALAELPYAVVTIYLGDSLVNSQMGTIFLGGAGLIALSAAAIYLLRKNDLIYNTKV